jgi:chemotaxis protein MotB
MAKREAKGITIIKREEVVEGGHHGGAWKVAYADFVTAMMAFFLLMWLLNATTEEQRRGIADYFSPSATLATQKSGSGQPLSGKSPFEEGQAISDKGSVAVMNANAPPVEDEDDGSDTLATRTVHGPANPNSVEYTQQSANAKGKLVNQPGAGPKAAEAARRQEQADFTKAAASIQKAIQYDPALAPLARQLSVDVTPDGLRVQIRDSEGLPMFDTGSAEPTARATAVLQHLTPILLKLKEPISIAGYTDAQPYTRIGRTNWDLSADRANATRRILTENGLPDERILDVTGHGDRDLLVPAEPEAASNRRIAILLVRMAPPLPAPASH